MPHTQVKAKHLAHARTDRCRLHAAASAALLRQRSCRAWLRRALLEALLGKVAAVARAETAAAEATANAAADAAIARQVAHHAATMEADARLQVWHSSRWCKGIVCIRALHLHYAGI
jgi:hypothetical protein